MPPIILLTIINGSCNCDCFDLNYTIPSSTNRPFTALFDVASLRYNFF